MAYVKGFSLKNSIHNGITAPIDYVLDYANNRAKTDNGHLVTLHGKNTSIPSAVAFQWKNKRQMRHSTQKMGSIGFHMIHSFKPGEVTPEQAHEISFEWALEVTKNWNCDFVLATHTDQPHIHSHLIIDSLDEDGKGIDIRWVKEYERIRRISNKICRKHKLSVIAQENQNGEKYVDWMDKDGKAKTVKKLLDYAIPKVKDYQDLRLYLESLGCTVRDSDDRYRDSSSFRFTINRKLYIETDDKEETTKVRIPGKKDEFIFIPNEYIRWIRKKDFEEKQTAVIEVPADLNVMKQGTDRNIFISVDDLKEYFENKSKTRQGLAIRLPDSGRYIRTKRFGDEYTYSKVIERCQNNFNYETDPDIRRVIQECNEDNFLSIRKNEFSKAGIHFEDEKPSLYVSKKQEMFFKYKSEKMHKRMDEYNYNKLLVSDYSNIPKMQARAAELKNTLRTCNSTIKDLETEIQKMVEVEMENVSDDEKDSFENRIEAFTEQRNGLLQDKELLKTQIALYEKRIQNALDAHGNEEIENETTHTQWWKGR